MKTLKRIGSAIARATGKVARFVLPNFVLGHEKAIAGAVAPVVVAQVAHYIPSLHVGVPMVAQIVAAGVTALTVHTATNTGA
jgi:hypothetical protein